MFYHRFNEVPAEERLHWRSFLVKLGADNLKGLKNEELLVASHKSVYIVYTVLGDVGIFVVGKDGYDELACDLGSCSQFLYACLNLSLYSPPITEVP
ncbi:hypothetical protein HS088_TW22G00610 [Tripterygium wilfordii]|uniref:Coatomer subunit zeta n=1 Tax=Tripterygium wilfordii TaxID=458696 RepID=A0A7J7BZ10_TRIWF|nr:uncharacterized protein LOC119991018 isoform X2 [Tripterygium wilfordii]KAF5726925.1 hypothetical protein HS088_TW22G00610 [Tripterygium wilfordii]